LTEPTRQDIVKVGEFLGKKVNRVILIEVATNSPPYLNEHLGVSIADLEGKGMYDFLNRYKTMMAGETKSTKWIFFF